MPWSSQNGGGWKSGGGGPWGQGPSGAGGQPPDLEEMLRRGQDRLKSALPGGVGGGLITLIVLVGIVLVGFYGFTVRVNPDELGVVLRFGKFNRQLPPGLNSRLPYPIETVYLPQVTRVNRVEIGMRASPVGGLRNVPEESLMLTGDENIVDIDFTVFWRIKNAEKYLFNIQNPERTVKEVSESAMREIVGRSDLQPILTRSRKLTEDAVRDLTQKILDSYGAGIQITQVQLQKVDPPGEVIAAFRDVQAAKADQERVQNEAQAYANSVIPKARGDAARILQAGQAYKDQTVAEATGEAARFLKIYEQYRKAPDVTRQRMFLETMERVFAGTDKIILDSSKTGTGGVVPYLPLSELSKRPAGTGSSGAQQ